MTGRFPSIWSNSNAIRQAQGSATSRNRAGKACAEGEAFADPKYCVLVVFIGYNLSWFVEIVRSGYRLLWWRPVGERSP